MEWISTSPEETLELGKRLIQEFPQETIICLRGPLGSGKTCFAKGIGCELGIIPERIKSPTFTTLFQYEGTRSFYHCDFYRQDKNQPFAVEWWRELLETEDAMIVVEWAERIEEHLPEKRLEIDIVDLGENRRKLIINRLPHE